MTPRSSLRHGFMGVALLCISAGAAASDPPASATAISGQCGTPMAVEADTAVAEDGGTNPSGIALTESGKCDDSDPNTKDNCVDGACVNAPIVACPCAADFAAAVATYDARPGIPSSETWDVCALPHDSADKYVARRTKYDALSPSESGRTTLILLYATRNWTFWGTHPVECSAGVWLIASPHRVKPLFNSEVRDGLSDAELTACKTLIRAIARCPE